MTERGMIFNAEMVRAILDGRKTQTRRPIKWKKTRFTEIGEREDGSKWPWSEDAEHACDFWHPCPFGAVGDRIWVRETARCEWQRGDFKNAAFETGVTYKADGERQTFSSAEQHKTFPRRSHAANGDRAWHPSIHMPRWASRILLEITDVRVERLNAISEEDAEAEGIDMEALYDSQDCYDCIADHNMTGRPTVTGAFKYLWESIYGDESWKANPWVWVISFKRVEGGAA
ncbi:hypothetical protein [Klebsiella pneumoniae]|uniref:hypothetical protein n=1 Tax=Klebsiella pneumoniae TaxID=573 RepID=UPI000650F260|nr:hypothetical protein [Klebsiella pneumoniae]KMI19340.1 hypothetical protein SM86_02977 [Klebsiella pneumoniae]